MSTRGFDTHYPIQNADLLQFFITRKGYEVIVDVQSREPSIKHIISYIGSERICWECKEQRFLCLEFTLQGELVEYYDLCGTHRERVGMIQP